MTEQFPKVGEPIMICHCLADVEGKSNIIRSPHVIQFTDAVTGKKIRTEWLSCCDACLDRFLSVLKNRKGSIELVLGVWAGLDAAGEGMIDTFEPSSPSPSIN